jgi:hypothetical protein
MEFQEIDTLLNCDPLRLEMGIERLASGVLHVAARTDMHNTKGRMFEWWFQYFTNSEQYVWWHPGDHVFLKWDDRYTPANYIGATCLVDERLGGKDVYRLFIHFVDPGELFTPSALTHARATGDVSAIVTGQFGLGENPPRTTDGSDRPLGSQLLHVLRDTPFGCALRSHFYLGLDLQERMSPREIAEMIPDKIGLNLMKHAYSEFTFLSRFLPSLYIAAKRESEPIPLPW